MATCSSTAHPTPRFPVLLHGRAGAHRPFAQAVQGLVEGGCTGANLPQKPAPSGRLAVAAAPGIGERLAQFTQQTWRGGATAANEEIVERQKKNSLN